MIKGNRIIFGYGDIAVGSCRCGFVSFTNIKPPQEVGTYIEENVELGLQVKLYELKPYGLISEIEKVNKDNAILEYNGYILDFSNFNEISLNVVKTHAKNTVNTMLLAC